jgi:hypothetical protein
MLNTIIIFFLIAVLAFQKCERKLGIPLLLSLSKSKQTSSCCDSVQHSCVAMAQDEFGENRCGRNACESSFHRYVSFLEPDCGKTASFILISSTAAPFKGRWNGAV